MMSKRKKSTDNIKVVDYKSVNLAWLVKFRNRVLRKELAPEVQLVVAREDVNVGKLFEIHKGDTLCIAETAETSYTVNRPYGDVRQGEVPRSAVELKPREQWSTEDVAEYVIKRACTAEQCIYLELKEVKGAVSKEEYKGTFVSQARRCRFADLVGSLEYFYALKKADIADQYVWLDIFCANQPKLTARNVEQAVRKQNERQLTEGLHIAIANFEQRVLFMDKWDDAAPLTRAWCVWEIFGVAKAKKPLEIALPESEYDRFIVTLKEDYGSIITKTAAVDVARAQCFNPADLATIHQAILLQSSFQALNDIVKTQLRFWVASVGEVQVEREELKANPRLDEIVLLANQSGCLYRDQGDYVKAEPLLKKALHGYRGLHGDEHDTVAKALCNLAQMFNAQGKFSQAEKLYLEALRVFLKVYGAEHPVTGNAYNDLGNLYAAKGEFAKAESRLQIAVQVYRKALGPTHPSVGVALNNLARLYNKQNKYSQAIPLFEEALAIVKKAHGDDHQLVAAVLTNLSQSYQAQGMLADAEALQKEGLKISARVYGKEHPKYALQLNNLAMVYKAQGKLDAAEAPMLESLAIFKKVFGARHPDVATLLDNISALYSDKGMYEEAAKLVQEALEIHSQTLGKEHPSTIGDIARIGFLLQVQRKFDQAEPVLREVVDLRRKVQGKKHPDYAIALNNLALCLQALGKYRSAQRFLEESLAISKEVSGVENPLYAQTLNNLAGVQRAQGKNKKAKELGVRAYEIARRVLGEAHPHTQNYKFYTTWSY